MGRMSRQLFFFFFKKKDFGLDRSKCDMHFLSSISLSILWNLFWRQREKEKLYKNSLFLFTFVISLCLWTRRNFVFLEFSASTLYGEVVNVVRCGVVYWIESEIAWYSESILWSHFLFSWSDKCPVRHVKTTNKFMYTISHRNVV